MNIFELSEHAENIARAARKLANAACQWSASEKAAAGDREECARPHPREWAARGAMER